MKLEETDKVSIVKAFTEINKERKGKGPKNIYLKQEKSGIKIVTEGFLTDYEKYLLNTFGSREAYYMYTLYEKDIKNVERALLERINNSHDLYVEQVNCDFANDRLTYVVKYNESNT